ncbi:MAG: hypothetical protein KC586_11855 [Myxococcales bacterium]|nr:hypothetical protein [Myxococcales bacterium]
MSDHRRAPLAHQGGRVLRRGDEGLSRALEAALLASEDERDLLTHGFHAYPARLHPGIASVALDEFARPGDLVLDPFCGSGTVLVEAMVRGLESTGVDLNPLALRIAEVKTDVRDAASRELFRRTLLDVGVRSEARVRGRAYARAPLSREEATWWAPHVLKELAGLRQEILAVGDERDRRALLVVFSAILVKVSLQRADTTERATDKRIRKGLSTEMFVRKGEELVERWEELETATKHGAPAPELTWADASRLPPLQGDRFDLVLSSPPYGGTYDYVDHHARRYAWLDLDAEPLRRGELGARRHLRDERDTRRWDAEVDAFLRSLRGVVRTDALALLVVGDGQIGSRRIDAADQLAALGPDAGWTPLAAASQDRPDWTGRGARREHLVALGARR